MVRLKSVDLLEVSLVTFPANGKARVHDVKTVDELETIADFELILRDAGFSRKEAKTLLAKMKDRTLRDADEDLKHLLNRNINSIRGN